MAPQSDVKEFEQNRNETAKYKWEFVWQKVAVLAVTHLFGILAVINFITGKSSLLVTLYFMFIVLISLLLGTQCGVHRLWSHRSFKANLPLRVLLMLANTITLQESIFDWCRDHRAHHKFSETDADPYNSSRGFFFCHIGWLMVRKHPDVKKKAKCIDLTDLLSDPVVTFQRTYYYPLVLLMWGIIPMGSAMYLFDISLFHAFCENCLRFVISEHLASSVNSVAHLYGMRPYDKSINPRNNWFVIYLGNGEGYHNYHHVFPYDYSASEFGWKTNWNPPSAFIHFFQWIGWATDLKSAPKSSIKARKERTGDQLANHYENKFYTHLIFEYITGFISMLMPVIILYCLRMIYLCAFYMIY